MDLHFDIDVQIREDAGNCTVTLSSGNGFTQSFSAVDNPQFLKTLCKNLIDREIPATKERYQKKMAEEVAMLEELKAKVG